MKATTLLERQHQSIRQLCEAIERGSASVRASLVMQLASDLSAHMRMEDDLFYAAVKPLLRERNWFEEHGDHHRLARMYIGELVRTPAGSAHFDDRISRLRALVDDHVEVEERGLFAEAERALGPDGSRALAASMMAVHSRMLEAGFQPEELIDNVADGPGIVRAIARYSSPLSAAAK